MTSLGNRVFADVINYVKMRSYLSTVGSKSNMTGVLIRKGKETQRDTGRWPCDDRGTGRRRLRGNGDKGKEGGLKTTGGVVTPRGAGTAETEGGVTKWPMPTLATTQYSVV